MDMQDKEFDELFHSKLDGLEVTPSAQVWDNIAGELQPRKRRRYLMPFLSVAASIAVLVTAGVLFIPKKQAEIIKQPVKTQTARVVPHSTTQQVTLQVVKSEPVKQIGKSPVINGTASVNQIALNQINKKTAADPNVNTAAVDSSKNDKINSRQVLAAMPLRKVDIAQPVVPDGNTPLNAQQPDGSNPDFMTKPSIAAVQLPEPPKPDIAPVKTKHRIRSFGDLVNVVVATVDKRKDKVIEFSNTDGDEATITGVNLGIVKIKKEDK